MENEVINIVKDSIKETKFKRTFDTNYITNSNITFI